LSGHEDGQARGHGGERLEVELHALGLLRSFTISCCGNASVVLQDEIEPGLEGHGVGRDGGRVRHHRHTRPLCCRSIFIAATEHDVSLDHRDSIITQRIPKLQPIVGRVSPPHLSCRLHLRLRVPHSCSQIFILFYGCNFNKTKTRK
jgi:hypothetical protein